MGETIYLDNFREGRQVPTPPSAEEFGSYSAFYDADLVHRMIRSMIETGSISPGVATDIKRLSEDAKERVWKLYESSMSELNERKQ